MALSQSVRQIQCERCFMCVFWADLPGHTGTEQNIISHRASELYIHNAELIYQLEIKLYYEMMPRVENVT